MTYFFNPNRLDDPTDPNSSTAPDLVAIAPPELSPGEPIAGYVPCEYDQNTKTITFPDGSTIQFPPIIESGILPDFLGFRNAIEELVTEPFLNSLNTESTALMLSLRDGFLNQDIANIIKYWNRAITHYGMVLIPVLDVLIQDENTTKTRANFAREKASFYHLPINLSSDYLLELT